MKVTILLLLLTSSISISAQRPLDTIYANDNKNVTLFFPNPIRQSVTGASHFIFTYNLEKQQHFGLLQAKPGLESNLLTVTIDGMVYSYILKYSKELSKLNYFINEEGSIGNEAPAVKPVKQEIKPSIINENRVAYFQRACDYLLKSNYQTIGTIHKKGIKLQLQKMVYDGSEVYLVMNVQNKSGIEFEIDYLNVYITNGNKKRKASFQVLKQKVIFEHKMVSSILDGFSQRFVYVLPKFVLGDNEKLMLELKEFRGSRKIVLETKI